VDRGGRDAVGFVVGDLFFAAVISFVDGTAHGVASPATTVLSCREQGNALIQREVGSARLARLIDNMKRRYLLND
jgi:hypothetical protein